MNLEVGERARKREERRGKREEGRGKRKKGSLFLLTFFFFYITIPS
jgi:hypothetical protein